MSYQPEERYWTDYVRVATPIVGLLLLLGVFWYWASSLIGADSEEPPPTAIVTVIPDPTSTPTATVPPEPTSQTVETPEATPTEEGPAPTATEEERPTRTPTEETPAIEEPADCGRFQAGETILSSDNDVNMRSDTSTDADVVEVLTLDQALTVIDCPPVESGGFVWWHVRNEDNGNEGWVVDDWLKAQE